MLQELPPIQELPPVHELDRRFVEAIAWTDIAMAEPERDSGLFAHEFFASLRDCDPHDMEAHWQLIQSRATRQGAPLRRFAFVEPGRLSTLWDESFEDELTRVVTARGKELSSYPQSGGHDPCARGGILYFEPEWSLLDGSSMVASGGFFDVDNFPPADTWIAYILSEHGKEHLTGFLLSWVPEELVDLVDRAIAVDNSGGIRWAYDEPTPLVQRMCRLLQLTCPLEY